MCCICKGDVELTKIDAGLRSELDSGGVSAPELGCLNETLQEVGE